MTAGATTPQGAPRTPRGMIVILLDSLNRHMLGAYGGDEFDTPSLDALARRSLRFTRHYAGSLPCIPARHDILCGAQDFLWRPWGSVEVWESSIVRLLREQRVITKLVTDHPHLFEAGGENYHVDFTAWDYERGHESDAWKTAAAMSAVGAPVYYNNGPWALSRTYFDGEEEFPGPRTMRAAAHWIEKEARLHDRFLLFVDEFDPHEPWDLPAPYDTMYRPSATGPIWPPYATRALETGALTPEIAEHLRGGYGGKLTMIDHWLGRILAAMDAQSLWDDVALVLLTDHGHYLGERDTWGKPKAPLHQPMVHIPMFVAWPGVAPRDVDALTTSVDVFSTIADSFGVQPRHPVHGRSLLPVIAGDSGGVRDHLLAGIWSREVHVITGDAKYVRAPQGDNAPLSVWSNRWSTLEIPLAPRFRMPPPDSRATLDRMPGTEVPVIRQPYQPDDDLLPHWARDAQFGGNHLYALDEDPCELHDLAGTRREREMEDLLHHALDTVQAPAEQYERLALPQ
jgi:arylsulfatase A-like enzyme